MHNKVIELPIRYRFTNYICTVERVKATGGYYISHIRCASKNESKKPINGRIRVAANKKIFGSIIKIAKLEHMMFPESKFYENKYRELVFYRKFGTLANIIFITINIPIFFAATYALDFIYYDWREVSILLILPFGFFLERFVSIENKFKKKLYCKKHGHNAVTTNYGTKCERCGDEHIISK